MEEVCERGAGAWRVAPAPGTKWPVLFIERALISGLIGENAEKGAGVSSSVWVTSLWFGGPGKGGDKVQE